MGRYVVVLGPVFHNGARYDEGAELPISKDEAAPLIAIGVAALVSRPVRGRRKAAEPA